MIKSDDRRLPAQTRKTIGPTLKNGYIVKNKLEFTRGESLLITDTTSLRCGSLAYIGGDDDKKIQRFANENVVQLKHTAVNRMLHMTSLLTHTSYNHQDLMIDTTKFALEKENLHFSNIPTNIHGTLSKPALSPLISELTPDVNESEKSDFMNRSARIGTAARISNLINKASHIMNVLTCASGQDRTGTIMEAATQLWITQQYADNNITVSREEIEKVRLMGCHNALIATLATPGSYGMKKDSEAGNYFSDIVNKFLYRKTANTNKYPPVDDSMIRDLISVWNSNFTEANTIFMGKMRESTSSIEIGKTLRGWLNKAITYNDETTLSGVLTNTFRLFSNKPNMRQASVELDRILLDFLRDLIRKKTSTGHSAKGK